jgi:peptidyl-prolyl cis-trans isomerase A (cyclophilin A)
MAGVAGERGRRGLGSKGNPNRACLRAAVESLESRRLLSVSAGVGARFDIVAGGGEPLGANVGTIDVELFQNVTPLTVANFLNYVNRGDFDNSLIHRAVPGFVVQGGGYNVNTPGTHISEDPPVQNEFNPANPNTRGKIAMAKAGNDPNSATSEWFFNLSNNSANLDTQNGGFTSFGQALGDGVRVMDVLGAQSTYAFGGAFSSVPLYRYSTYPTIPPTAENFFSVSSLKQVDLLTVNLGGIGNENAVTFHSSHTDGQGVTTVSTSTVGLSGGGAATLKLTGVGLNYVTDGNTVTISGTDIKMDEANTSSLLPSSILYVSGSGSTTIGGLNVTTTAALRTITYRDNDSSIVNVNMTGPGLVTAKFAGDNLQVQAVKGVLYVTGNNIQLNEVDTTATTVNSSLNINASRGADSQTTIGGIFADGSLGRINAPRINISGGQVSLDGVVGILDLRTLSHSQISQRGTAGFSTIRIGAAGDTSIISASPIRLFKTQNWVDNDDQKDFIQAPFITTIQDTGNLGAGLKLTGAPSGLTLTNARIRGAVSGQWSVTGSIGAINTGSLAEGFSAQVSGAIGRLQSRDVTGSLTAGSIGAMSVRSMNSANLTLTTPVAAGVFALRTLVSAGAVNNSTIKSSGNVGSIVAGSMTNSTIFAGVTGNSLPTNAADFSSQATINSLALTHPVNGAAFVNSKVASYVLGRVALGPMQLYNNGNPFGVAAGFVRSLSASDSATGQSIALQNVTTQTQVDSILSSRAFNLVNAKITLVG